MKKIKSLLTLLAVSTTLTGCDFLEGSFNLDDVLGSFGPGDFNSELINNSNSELINEQQNILVPIAATVYAKNISCHFAMVDENGNQASNSWSIEMEKDNDNYHIYSKDAEGMDYYIKDNNSILEVYAEGKYEKVEDYNPNLFTMIPCPSFDDILYINYGVYQDGVGKMSEILTKYVDSFYYDEESGYHKIDKIEIKHGTIDTPYATEPDELTLSYWVKLSEDGKYMESFILEFISSQLGISGARIKMEFYNYQSTKINLPNP